MSIACADALPVSVDAENLREIRAARGLTQEAIGGILGLQKEQVSRIETGGRALSHAEKMVLDAALLGRPVPPVTEAE